MPGGRGNSRSYSPLGKKEELKSSLKEDLVYTELCKKAVPRALKRGSPSR